MCVCIYVYLCVSMSLCLAVCVYVCVCVCVCVCVRGRVVIILYNASTTPYLTGALTLAYQYHPHPAITRSYSSTQSTSTLHSLFKTLLLKRYATTMPRPSMLPF